MSRLYIDTTDGITAIYSKVNGYAENIHSNGSYKDFSKSQVGRVVAENLGVSTDQLINFLRELEYPVELLPEGGE
jgi:hypothetical protein